jgi:hypothetical protein
MTFWNYLFRVLQFNCLFTIPTTCTHDIHNTIAFYYSYVFGVSFCVNFLVKAKSYAKTCWIIKNCTFVYRTCISMFFKRTIMCDVLTPWHLILCFVDRASRHMRVMKPNWCTIYLQFIQLLYQYCFGLASSPLSEGRNVYMRQLVVRLSRLSAGLDLGPPTVDRRIFHAYVIRTQTILPLPYHSQRHCCIIFILRYVK